MKLLSMLIATASAEAVETASTTMFSGMSLIQKGITVTIGGLAGVFLVLCLFFITIKIMQKTSK